jgi:hypothetical protein
MVGLGGLEPPTSPLSGARSSHLSYRPEKTAWQLQLEVYCTRPILAILRIAFCALHNKNKAPASCVGSVSQRFQSHPCVHQRLMNLFRNFSGAGGVAVNAKRPRVHAHGGTIRRDNFSPLNDL